MWIINRIPWLYSISHFEVVCFSNWFFVYETHSGEYAEIQTKRNETWKHENNLRTKIVWSILFSWRYLNKFVLGSPCAADTLSLCVYRSEYLPRIMNLASETMKYAHIHVEMKGKWKGKGKKNKYAASIWLFLSKTSKALDFHYTTENRWWLLFWVLSWNIFATIFCVVILFVFCFSLLYRALSLSLTLSPIRGAQVVPNVRLHIHVKLEHTWYSHKNVLLPTELWIFVEYVCVLVFWASNENAKIHT